jgi:hypothetical protein
MQGNFASLPFNSFIQKLNHFCFESNIQGKSSYLANGNGIWSGRLKSLFEFTKF